MPIGKDLGTKIYQQLIIEDSFRRIRNESLVLARANLTELFTEVVAEGGTVDGLPLVDTLAFIRTLSYGLAEGDSSTFSDIFEDTQIGSPRPNAFITDSLEFYRNYLSRSIIGETGLGTELPYSDPDDQQLNLYRADNTATPNPPTDSNRPVEDYAGIANSPNATITRGTIPFSADYATGYTGDTRSVGGSTFGLFSAPILSAFLSRFSTGTIANASANITGLIIILNFIGGLTIPTQFSPLVPNLNTLTSAVVTSLTTLQTAFDTYDTDNPPATNAPENTVETFLTDTTSGTANTNTYNAVFTSLVAIDNLFPNTIYKGNINKLDLYLTELVNSASNAYKYYLTRTQVDTFSNNSEIYNMERVTLAEEDIIPTFTARVLPANQIVVITPIPHTSLALDTTGEGVTDAFAISASPSSANINNLMEKTFTYQELPDELAIKRDIGGLTVTRTITLNSDRVSYS